VKTIALIPARIGSKGVPGKNFRALNGRSCLLRAIDCAREAGVDQIVVSSDRVAAIDLSGDFSEDIISGVTWLGAYAPLHTDGCAMIEIVRDTLERVPGAPEDIWILLQPSSPLRTKNQITTAIDLLKFTGADSVVTVRRAVSCDALLAMDVSGTLRGATRPIYTTPPRQRQLECFVRDGTAYVFWRRTVRDFDHIYGVECRPMIINVEQSLSIDTPQDWEEADRRLKAIENARLAS
jgi:CMP-N-acetylneuraminic acid synthetase